MSSPITEDGRPVSPSLVLRVEEVCDRFEAEWKAGGRPRVEEFVGAAPEPGRTGLLRELLALQSSDWAFLATRQQAGPYPEERAAAHAEALELALEDEADADPALRNLAPVLAGWTP